jgi:hypothetical protein
MAVNLKPILRFFGKRVIMPSNRLHLALIPFSDIFTYLVDGPVKRIAKGDYCCYNWYNSVLRKTDILRS